MMSKVVGHRLRLIQEEQEIELPLNSKFVSAEIDKFGIVLYFWLKVPFEAKPIKRRFVVVRTDEQFTNHARAHLFSGRAENTRTMLHVFELKE